jgi:hypothetical protein
VSARTMATPTLNVSNMLDTVRADNLNVTARRAERAKVVVIRVHIFFSGELDWPVLSRLERLAFRCFNRFRACVMHCSRPNVV